MRHLADLTHLCAPAAIYPEVEEDKFVATIREWAAIMALNKSEKGKKAKEDEEAKKLEGGKVAEQVAFRIEPWFVPEDRFL
jgi:hypothetical protein